MIYIYIYILIMSELLCFVEGFFFAGETGWDENENDVGVII